MQICDDGCVKGDALVVRLLLPTLHSYELKGKRAFARTLTASANATSRLLRWALSRAVARILHSVTADELQLLDENFCSASKIIKVR